MNTNVQFQISESAALSTALDTIGAEKYAWQDSNLETAIKIRIDATTSDTVIDTSKTYYPTGELVIIPKSDTIDFSDTSNYVLCWKFIIQPMHLDTVVVDTNTVDTIPHFDTVAKYIVEPNIIVYINSINGGVQKIDSNRREGSYVTCTINETWYHGIETTQAWKKTIGSRRYARDERNINVEDLNNAGTIWSHYGAGQWGKFTESSSYWCLQKAWDYFSDDHGFIHGPNSCSVDPISKPHFNEQKIYANWAPYATSGQKIFYQNGVGTRDDYYISKDLLTAPESTRSLAQLDFISHEYTHAIIHAGPDFNNIGDAAAISEGFCDYFGIYSAIKYESSRYNNDWSSGIGFNHTPLSRNFTNPSSDGISSFDYYYGTSAFHSAISHRKSGVLRKVLGLSEWGGWHGAVYVNPIPNPNRDAFITMFWWSWSNMNYHNIAQAFADEYEYRYGKCSAKWCSIVRAWASVGLYSLPFCARSFIHGPHTYYVVGHTGVLTTPTRFSGSSSKPSITVGPSDQLDTQTWKNSIISFSWTVPQAWQTSHPNQDMATLVIDSLPNLYSGKVSCIVTYTDSTKDTLQTVVHFVGDNYETHQSKDIHNDNSPEHSSFSDSNISVFPNPATNQITIQFSEENEDVFTVSMYNLLGQKILERDIANKKTVLPLPILNGGIYILKISGKNCDWVKRISINQ